MNRKDAGAGIVFVLIGLFFALQSTGLEMGTRARMGPGMFPLILSGLLVILGIVIIVRGIGHATPATTPVPWRGLVLILLPPIVFAVTARGLGLVPSIALVAFITAFASQRMRLPLAFALTAGLTVFCAAVFHYALGLPLVLFGRWLGV